MKRLLIFLISFVSLSGCATPTVDPWQGLDVDMSDAATSIDCGSFPMPVSTTQNSATWDKQGMNALNDYRKCGDDQALLVDEHAQQIGQLKVARKGLTEAGQAQSNIASMKQEMLDDERKHNSYTSVGYWIVIIGMGLAL